jgi:hypothetical protein
VREADMSDPSVEPAPQNTPEPLLPVEKKLIGWSLGIGIVLLVLLAALNHFVPVTL